MQTSGLHDILERLVAEKKTPNNETANNDVSVLDEADKSKVPLRDREFTKSELARLEKKSWIEIKDLIFETEPSILDYLSFHCKRWRQSKSNNLTDKNKANRTGKGKVV